MNHLSRATSARARNVALLVAALLLFLGSALPANGSAEPAQRHGIDASAAPATGSARAAARCRTNGDYVWSHLGKCGWAGPANTGPRVSTCPNDKLRDRGHNARSVIRVTRPGTTISCQRIIGCLNVEAPGVTIRDVAIRCTSGRTGEDANGTAVIDVRPGGAATIERVAVNGMKGVHACVWHMGKRLRVNGLDCKNVNDGIFSFGERGQGDDFVIRNSYVHDLTTRTANGHVDGYQTTGAVHGRLIHNTWLITTDAHNEATSAIAIWNGTRNSRDIVVKRNLIAGGGFSVYAHDYSPSEEHPQGGNTVTDTHFVDNVFSRHLFGCVGYFGIWFPRGSPSDGWHRSGNRLLETGANVDRGNPSYQGRSCN
jgi:hypothetical protein